MDEVAVISEWAARRHMLGALPTRPVPADRMGTAPAHAWRAAHSVEGGRR